MVLRRRKVSPFNEDRVLEVMKRLFDTLSEEEIEDPNIFLNVLSGMLAIVIWRDYSTGDLGNAEALVDRFAETVKNRIQEG